MVTRPTFALILAGGAFCLVALLLGPLAVQAQSEGEGAGTIFLPLVHRHGGGQSEPAVTPVEPPAAATPTPTSTETPAPPQTLEWDPRLDARGAWLVGATVTPGAGYWRLISARWYDSSESAGRHHVLMDVRNMEGERVTGLPLLVSWPDGSTSLATEAKPGEAYAAAFAMFSIAPAYAAQPNDGAPADAVHGMGMGEIDDPYRAHHTSYGLTWRWTVAATVTPAATPSPVASPTANSTPTPTPTSTPTQSTEPSPTPTATPTATPAVGLVFDRAEYAGCSADTNATRIMGTVYRSGQPADGYRVVFSWQADGAPVTPPAISGPTPPGAYTHIVNGRVGDWWVWIVDQSGMRISPMAFYHSDEGCNIGEVNFYGP